MKSIDLCEVFTAIVLTIASSQSLTAQKAAPDSNRDTWWRHAVIYEVYPRSFQDSDGDGVGDLQGIIQRLDYLKWLGVDAIWLTPIYPSPQVDFGYDISDYQQIDPTYGSLADFDRLVLEAKKRNIRVLMDAVLNHTSDMHAWFEASRSSRENPKRDWYIWRNGKAENQPPNNWKSLFGHSAWSFDAETKQWYYHRFYKEQPDLNWRNPSVEQAMLNMARFWLDRGVAGFRLDAVPTIFEDPSLKDAKVLPGNNAYGDPNLDTSLTDNLPEVHDVLRKLRKVVDSYSGDRVLIGETYLQSVTELRAMYGAQRDELQLPMDMQVGFLNKLDPKAFAARIEEAESQIDGNQPLFVFDNHDNPRSWDRYGDGIHNLAITKLLTAILLTTRSTPILYYGEELGMSTTPPLRREDVKDPIGRIGWPNEKGRDGERTPMQWDRSNNAGFTHGAPWLPIPESHQKMNVQVEAHDSSSVLRWTQQLIQLRRENWQLRDGDLEMIKRGENGILAYLRRTGTPGKAVLIVCNFNATSADLSLSSSLGFSEQSGTKTLASSERDVKILTNTDILHLPAYSVWVGEIK